MRTLPDDEGTRTSLRRLLVDQRRRPVPSPPSEPRRRVAFVSSNLDWGGSEELWTASAAELATAGHDVRVYKAGIVRDEPRVARLRELGVPLTDLGRLAALQKRFSLLRHVLRPLAYALAAPRLLAALRLRSRPELVVISQGHNRDGWPFANACRKAGVPYVLVVQKADGHYWPGDETRAQLRRAYADAVWTYFVSEDNRRTTEDQLGLELPLSSVVRNPYLVPARRREDWPEQDSGLRLACIGRLDPSEKGQDLLFRVLAQPKWRARQVRVSVVGEGSHREGLEDLAQRLGLESVTFRGFVRDVAGVWDDHHALVLTSRCEGLPLVAVEAMMSSRVPILTTVGGAAEIVEDGVTGFLAASATVEHVDEVLERAWEQRQRWRAMGALAGERIRQLVPESPEADFATELLGVVGRLSGAPTR